MSKTLTTFLAETAEEFERESLEAYRKALMQRLETEPLPQCKKQALDSGDLLRLFHVLEHEAYEACAEGDRNGTIYMNIIVRFPPR